MKKVEQDYKTYTLGEMQRRRPRFMLIDPPWMYKATSGVSEMSVNRSTPFAYWGKDNRAELLAIITALPDSVDALFIWTTNPMLEAAMRAVFELKHFRFRSLLTWEKLTANGNQAKVAAHYFMNCTEFLLFVVRKKPSTKIPTLALSTHYASQRRGRTQKPKELERQIVEKIGGKWDYLFSGPDVSLFEGLDINCVDIAHDDVS